MANKHSHNVYRRRRIIALICIGLLIIMLIRVLNSNRRRTGASIPDENKSQANILEEMNISTKPVQDINTRIAASFSNSKFSNPYSYDEMSMDLLTYRQETLKDQSMARGPRQSLLNKEAYLTFDDGPSDVTLKILDILKEEDVKASFFVIGKNVRNRPEVIQRIYDEGHDIGIHTDTHDYKNIYASDANLSKDIDDCLQAIRDVVGEDFDTNLYRFPGGSFGREEFKPMVKEKGYVYFDWNVLNGDAEKRNPSEAYVIDRLKKTSKDYNKQIILMHDSDTKEITANTLDTVIRDLKDDGFEFKTLGDMN